MFPIKEQHVPHRNGVTYYESLAYEEAMKMTQGMAKLGGGLYAKTYGNSETPFVVKVGRMTDRGYRAYLSVMQELGIQNPYLPRILDVTYFTGENAYGEKDVYFSFFAVRMEKLERGDYNYAWSEEGDSPFAQACRIIRAAADDRLSLLKADSVLEEAIAVIQLARDRVYRDHENVSFDLHCGNVMLRGEQLVITDPLA